MPDWEWRRLADDVLAELGRPSAGPAFVAISTASHSQAVDEAILERARRLLGPPSSMVRRGSTVLLGRLFGIPGGAHGEGWTGAVDSPVASIRRFPEGPGGAEERARERRVPRQSLCFGHGEDVRGAWRCPGWLASRLGWSITIRPCPRKRRHDRREDHLLRAVTGPGWDIIQPRSVGSFRAGNPQAGPVVRRGSAAVVLPETDLSSYTGLLGIRRVLPGQIVELDSGELKLQPQDVDWTAAALGTSLGASPPILNVLLDCLRALIRRPTRVGVHLSGGVNSAAVCWAAARALEEVGGVPRRDLVCITGRFGNPSFAHCDDSQYAQSVARHLGADWVAVANEDCPAFWPSGWPRGGFRSGHVSPLGGTNEPQSPGAWDVDCWWMGKGGMCCLTSMLGFALRWIGCDT